MEDEIITKIRDEIEWVHANNLMFTSLFIWDNTYTPYQVALFRKNSNNHSGIRAYFNTGDYIHTKDFSMSIDTGTTEDEILFHITRTLKDILVENIDEWLWNHQKDLDQSDEQQKEVDALLKEVFYDKHTMSLFKGSAPDFGFYSLSPNFHKLKKLAKDGRTPTINDEFDRLLNKYKK